MQSFIASLTTATRTSRATPSSATTVKRFFNSTQTGKSVARVRWLNDGSTFTVTDSLATEYFVAGSSTGITEDNDLSLWRLSIEGSRTGVKTPTMECVDKMKVIGNIAGMSAIGAERFAVNSCLGNMTVYKCVNNVHEQEEPNNIQEVFSKELHSFKGGKVKCPATSLVSKGNSIVSVGEDGSIFEISAATAQTLRSMEQVDPLSIYSVAITGVGEIITGNSAGQLKLWDLRGCSSKPEHTMNSNVLLNNLYGAISIAQHPSQSHCLLVGYQSGCLDLWDIRLGTGSDPIANLASNTEGSLSEIYFHGISPDHFYSCCQSGELSHWFPADYTDEDTFMPENVDHENELNLEFLTRGIANEELYSSSLPLNSLNLSKHDRIVCAGDSGVIYCTEIKGV